MLVCKGSLFLRGTNVIPHIRSWQVIKSGGSECKETLNLLLCNREENPGVDKLYMSYVTYTTGSGGWPTSVFLTPERYPFFGATYLAPQDQHGRPGFKTLLSRIAQVWATAPDKVRSSGENMVTQLKAFIEVHKPCCCMYTSFLTFFFFFLTGETCFRIGAFGSNDYRRRNLRSFSQVLRSSTWRVWKCAQIPNTCAAFVFDGLLLLL